MLRASFDRLRLPLGTMGGVSSTPVARAAIYPVIVMNVLDLRPSGHHYSLVRHAIRPWANPGLKKSGRR